MSDVFKALADPTRRQVLQALKAGPQSAGQLASAFPVSKPTMSAHFAVLREAGLVTTEKDWVRLGGMSGDLKRLQEASSVVPIRLSFNDQDFARLRSLVDAAVATGGYRRAISQPGVPRPTTVK